MQSRCPFQPHWQLQPIPAVAATALALLRVSSRYHRKIVDESQTLRSALITQWLVYSIVSGILVALQLLDRHGAQGRGQIGRPSRASTVGRNLSNISDGTL